MLFGDPAQFAIEAHHEPQGPSWLGFGRMALHFGNVTLGDLSEEHCSLHDAASRIRDVISRIRTTWLPEFLGHSDAEIFAQIDKELYVDYGQTEAHIKSSQKQYELFDFLTNAGEQFDDVKTFIYCGPDSLVHVLYEDRARNVASVTCSVDRLELVSQAFLQWFDAETKVTVGAA